MNEFKIEERCGRHCVQVPSGMVYDFLERPALPLYLFGEASTLGWDIPNYWAIDADGECWLDASGHGSGMRRVSLGRLLEQVAEDGTDENLREQLQLKPRMPEWVRAARAAGWTPPPTWDASAYATSEEERALERVTVPSAA